MHAKLAELDKKIKEKPDNAENYVELGKTYRSNPSLAETYYKKALELDANSAEAHLGMGGIHFGRHMYQKTACMAREDANPPQSGDLKSRLKFMMEQRKKRAEDYIKEHPEEVQAAIDESKMAIKLDPKLGDAYLLLGSAQEESGDKKAAIKTFEDFLKNKATDNEKVVEAVKGKIDELKGKKKPMIQVEEVKTKPTKK